MNLCMIFFPGTARTACRLGTLVPTAPCRFPRLSSGTSVDTGDVCQAMWKEMSWWKPAAKMAEQEFRSWYWAGQ